MQLEQPLIPKKELLEAYREHRTVDFKPIGARNIPVQILVLNELGELVTFFGTSGDEYASGYVDYKNNVGGIALNV